MAFDKRAYEREWRKRKYAEDPEYRQRKRATDKRSRDALVAEVAEYKLKIGCERCGYSKCSRALEFHHIDESTKLFDVASKLSSRISRQRIFDEIAKCVILCSNCHAEEHCEGKCCNPDLLEQVLVRSQ